MKCTAIKPLPIPAAHQAATVTPEKTMKTATCRHHTFPTLAPFAGQRNSTTRHTRQVECKPRSEQNSTPLWASKVRVLSSASLLKVVFEEDAPNNHQPSATRSATGTLSHETRDACPTRESGATASLLQSSSRTQYRCDLAWLRLCRKVAGEMRNPTVVCSSVASATARGKTTHPTSPKVPSSGSRQLRY